MTLSEKQAAMRQRWRIYNRKHPRLQPNGRYCGGRHRKLVQVAMVLGSREARP